MSITFNRADPTVPVYRTEYLYNRDGLRDLFAREWGYQNADYGHVDSFLMTLTPYRYLPFPDAAPHLPGEESSYADSERERVWRAHEEKRKRTRKDRALYDLAGVEVYVPSTEYPSIGDSDATWNRKQERISNLRTDDLTTNEEH